MCRKEIGGWRTLLHNAKDFFGKKSSALPKNFKKVELYRQSDKLKFEDLYKLKFDKHKKRFKQVLPLAGVKNS